MHTLVNANNVKFKNKLFKRNSLVFYDNSHWIMVFKQKKYYSKLCWWKKIYNIPHVYNI